MISVFDHVASALRTAPPPRLLRHRSSCARDRGPLLGRVVHRMGRLRSRSRRRGDRSRGDSTSRSPGGPGHVDASIARASRPATAPTASPALAPSTCPTTTAASSSTRTGTASRPSTTDRHRDGIDHLWIRVATSTLHRFYELAGQPGSVRERDDYASSPATAAGSHSWRASRRRAPHRVPRDGEFRGRRVPCRAHRRRLPDNGPPGERPIYHAGYYGAFVLDPDGTNVELVNHNR